MNVYLVAECEEYEFQIDHGLWTTHDRAVEDAKQRGLEAVQHHHQIMNLPVPTQVSVLVLSPDKTLVLAGEWTIESFEAWRAEDGNRAYWWYRPPFDHSGAFGVFRVEVQE